jgi:hypothetical protein
MPKQKAPYNLVAYDGEKAVTIWGDEGWTIMSGGDKERPDTEKFYAARVGIVFRAMQLRANGVASIPFDLVKVNDPKNPDDDEVVESSEKWTNQLGFMPYPELLFGLIESAWILGGKAYLYKSMNTYKTVKILRLLAPDTVKYNVEKDIFSRATKAQLAQDKFYAPAIDKDGKLSQDAETIVALWMPDPDVERGEPLKYPAKAALSAMGVLFNLDDAATGFFKRGMLHTYAFQVPAGTQPRDKEELEEKVKSMLSGIRNAWRTIFTNIDVSKYVDLGGDLEQLANVPLVREERENVSIALGVPYSKLFSAEAKALGGKGVVDADDRRLIEDSCLPDWKHIARGINEQVLLPLGYRLQEHHERMSMFQENELDRGQALQAYTDAFNTNPEVAMIVSEALGFKLPDELVKKFQAIVDRKNAEPKPVVVKGAPVAGPADQPKPDNPDLQGNVGSGDMEAGKMAQEATVDLAKWQRKASKKVGQAVTFDSDAIPADVYAAIFAALPGCKTVEEVRAVFAEAEPAKVKAADPLLALAASINKLAEKG